MYGMKIWRGSSSACAQVGESYPTQTTFTYPGSARPGSVCPTMLSTWYRISSGPTGLSDRWGLRASCSNPVGTG